jgi:hypothetical protein
MRWATGCPVTRPGLTPRCSVANDSFPGFTSFLEAAARQIGRPEAAGPARRITTLSALANLCAQASVAEPAHAPAIMAKAEEFREQLHAALAAADLMLDEVKRLLGLSRPALRGDLTAGRRPLVRRQESRAGKT